MPTVVKHVLVFKDSTGTGWTEVHFRNSESESPSLNSQLTTLVDTIAPARAALLSTDCSIVGARVSYPRPGAIASLPKRLFIVGPLERDGVSSALSLAVGFTDGTFTKTKITHLRGFWDDVEENGEYHPDEPRAGDWNARFNAWKGALIGAGYGWLSKAVGTSASGIVTNYTVGTDGLVTFTLQAAGMPLATVDTTQSVRFSKLNRSSSPLNRALLVYVTDRTHVTKVAPIGAGPFTAKGRFNFRATAFIAYNQVYNVSLGRRQQGRPLFQPPGRLPVRPRY